MRISSPIRTNIMTVFAVILVLTVPLMSIRPAFAAGNVTLPFQDGFETGNFSKWTVNAGGYVTSGSAQHGTYKAVLNASGQYQQVRFTAVDQCFFRAYVMFKSFPASGYETPVMGVYNTSGIYMSEVRVRIVAGTVEWALRYYNGGAHYTIASTQQKPVLNTWYCVEVEGKSNSATSSESRIYINGNELTDVTKTGLNNQYKINCAYIWESITGGVVQWYDDVVVNTSYIGPETYTLTTSVVGQGSISKDPNQSTYNWGTNVTLTANANPGWTFASWSGGATGTSNPVTITITDNTSVTATFTQDVYSLTVNTVGGGLVNLNYTGPYYYGDVVELTAVPSIGWSFGSWSGDLSGSVNPETILIDGDKSVTATFTQNEYSLTVNAVGSGLVNLNNTGPCHYGDVVELAAVPSIGWSFDHWSGDLSGSTNPTTILIDGDKTVTANFAQKTYTLTVDTVGNGNVNLNNSGPYYYGDVVELAASSALGWSFSGWSGDLSGSVNPADLTITGNMTVTATFTQNTVSDVAVINVATSKTVVGQGQSLNINVTVENQGDSSETFDVTVYANATEIETQAITLSSGSSTTATFTWSTISFARGNYTISAYAWPVPGETDTTDNTRTDGNVIVAMVGDVAGIGTYPNTLPDGKVDIKDLAAIAKCYGANYPDPRYYTNYDLNGDGKIDIKDLAMAAKNYGK